MPKSNKKIFKVAVIGGDGIGPEVMVESLKVLRATKLNFQFTSVELGSDRFIRDGEVLSDETFEKLRIHDAILFGAVGSPLVRPGILERGIILKIRFGFDLYINYRPCSGIAPGKTISHDFVVIRENSEGPYTGEGGSLREGTKFEVATQGSINTAMAVERCIRFAFDVAMDRSRRRLTLVHKTNILEYSGRLWYRVFSEVATEYPLVETSYNHVDAACIYLVQDPQRYEVIVTDNLFGDILTDLAGAISGGIGRSASANLNPLRNSPSLFEPVHGSAPDIVGTGLADPIGSILSAGLMVDFLGEHKIAQQIKDSCENVGSGTTSEIGDQIAARVKAFQQ